MSNYALTTLNTRVGEILQDDAAKIAPGEVNNFIKEALRDYSRLRPRFATKDYDSTDGLNGTAFRFDVPVNWDYDFSALLGIEFPLDETVQNPTFLEDGDWEWYWKAGAITDPAAAPTLTQGTGGTLADGAYTVSYTWVDVFGGETKPSSAGSITLAAGGGTASIGVTGAAQPTLAKLMKVYAASGTGTRRLEGQSTTNTRTTTAMPASTNSVVPTFNGTRALRIWFLSDVPGSTQKFRLTYTQKVAFDDLSNVDIPDFDYDAVCNLAAAHCAGALARRYAQSSDSTIGADAITYLTKSQDYSRLRRELISQYAAHFGIGKEATVTAASGTGEWDTEFMVAGYPGSGVGRDFLTHPARSR